jgi:hypothetical protein
MGRQRRPSPPYNCQLGDRALRAVLLQLGNELVGRRLQVFSAFNTGTTGTPDPG